MSSDWELCEDGDQRWYVNKVTGEATYDPPAPFDSFDPGGTAGGLSGYAPTADTAATDDWAWQEDTSGHQWDEAAGQWVLSSSWDPRTQTGLYNFTQAGYYGEDGKWCVAPLTRYESI